MGLFLLEVCYNSSMTTIKTKKMITPIAPEGNVDFYVYRYSHPTTLETVYIGKGKGNRAFSHLKGSHNRRLGFWINKLFRSALMPVITIIPAFNENYAFELESKLIHFYGRADKKEGTLFNHTDG